jgi:zinc protease
MRRSTHLRVFRTCLPRLLLVQMAVSVPSWADIRVEDAFVHYEGIAEYRLPNGVRLVLAPQAGAVGITVNLTLLAGTHHESPEDHCLAHTVEHLLFAEAANGLKPRRMLEQWGVRYAASTRGDSTSLLTTIQPSGEKLASLLSLLHEMVLVDQYRPGEIEQTLRVIRQEERVAGPDARIVDVVWRRIGPLGSEDREPTSCPPITAVSISTFKRKFYRGEHIRLFVVGRFDPRGALARAVESFGAIPTADRPAIPHRHHLSAISTAVPEAFARGPQDFAAVIWAGPPLWDGGATAALVLMTALSENAVQVVLPHCGPLRTFREVFWDRSVTGIWSVPKHNNSPRCQQELEDILGFRNCAQGECLTAAKWTTARRFRRALDNSELLAEELGTWSAVGDWRLLFYFRDRIADVRVAPELAASSQVHPNPTFLAGSEREGDDKFSPLQTILASYRKQLDVATFGSATQSRIADPKGHSRRLHAGLSLICVSVTGRESAAIIDFQIPLSIARERWEIEGGGFARVLNATFSKLSPRMPRTSCRSLKLCWQL